MEMLNLKQSPTTDLLLIYRYRDASEMQDYLKKTGFVDFKFTPTAAARSILTAQKP
jgi:hypothetical protein